MIDKKAQFKLALQGKHNDGHMDMWCIIEEDFTGLVKGKYTLAARDGAFTIIDDEYVVVENSYYTLGEESTHAEMLEIYVGDKTKREYDPDDGMGHGPYKCWD